MFLDIGLSLIYTTIISHYFGIPITISIILLGIAFSLLPDIDVPIELWQRGRLGGKATGFHREITHYPILYIAITLAIFLYFGTFWTLLFGVNILSHLIHDSVWTGWGIKWLWPFLNRFYKLFSDKKGNFAKKFASSWSPSELKSTMEKYGDDDWFKKQYLHLSPNLILELVVLVLGVLFLLFFIRQI